MKTKAIWVVGVVIAFMFFLLAKLPAHQVLGRINFADNISLHQVEGTFWRGNMARLTVSGLPIENLSWRINPFALLIGNLSGSVKGGDLQNADDVAIDGPLSLSLFGFQPIQSDGLIVFLPTDLVIAQVQLPLPVNAGGRFRVRFDELDFGPTCEQMDGWGDWLNASVAGTQGPITLGSFTARLTCENEQIKMRVEEPNTLGLSFESTISPDFKTFSLQGKFKPNDDLPNEVHQAGRFFGTPGDDGYTPFKL